MEKFAVDLEKVLDEFEFSEEREERVALSVINNQSLPYISHVAPARPPVNSYRRPSFEPINIADADFAASPPRVSRHHHNQRNLTYNIGSISSGIQNNTSDNKTTSNIDKYRQSSDDRLTSNGLTISSNAAEILTKSISTPAATVTVSTSASVSATNDNTINNTLSPPLSSRESVISESWSEDDTSSLSDEKPDLLDCNTSSKSIIASDHHRRVINNRKDNTATGAFDNDDYDDSEEDSYNGAGRLLPDVTTSVSPVKCFSNQTLQDNTSLINNNNNNNCSSNANVFDLISNNSNNNVNNCNSVGLNSFKSNNSFSANEVKTDRSSCVQSEEAISSLYVENDGVVVEDSNSDVKATINDKISDGTTDEKGTSFDDGVSLENQDINLTRVDGNVSIVSVDEDNLSLGANSNEDAYFEIKDSIDKADDKFDNTSLSSLNNKFDNVSVNSVVSLEKSIVPIDVVGDKSDCVVKENNDNISSSINVLSLSLETQSHVIEERLDDSAVIEQAQPPLSEQAVGFSLDNEISDDNDDLEKYLEELEELEKSQSLNSVVNVADSIDPNNCDISDVKVEILPEQRLPTTPNEDRLSSLSSSQESDSDKEVDIDDKINDKLLDNSEEVACVENFNNELILKSNENNNATLILTENSNEKSNLRFSDEITNRNGEASIASDCHQINDDSISQLNSFMKSTDDNYLSTNDYSCKISESDNTFNSVIENRNLVATGDICAVKTHKSKSIAQERRISDKINALKGDNIKSKTEIEVVDTMGNSVDKNVSPGDNNSSEAVVANTEEVTNSVSILGGDSDSLTKSEQNLSQDKQRLSLESAEDNIDDGDISRVSRPNYLELPDKITVDPEANNDEASTSTSPSSATTITSADGVEVGNSGGSPLSCGELSSEECQLGKVAPFWVPDSDALTCMQCQQRFTMIKRRHHCRACGQVLCSKCCCMRIKLAFMEGEAKVCQPCYNIIGKANSPEGGKSPLGRQPNPNNPMEYCSTIPPLQQAAGSLHQPPPSVLVPVGVLKREGRVKSEVAKQVMFSDGIRPGGDLTELDGSGEPRLPFRRPGRLTKRVGTPPGGAVGSSGSMGGTRVMAAGSGRRTLDPITQSFIPAVPDGKNGDGLPPIVERVQGEIVYSQFDVAFSRGVKVDDEKPIKFAINSNLFVLVKRVLLDCCVNRECWCVTSSGLACVGQDEVILVLECLPDEIAPPKDIFLLINTLYIDASKGSTVSELSFSPSFSQNLFDSKDHGGFLYIRPSYQCTSKLLLPSPPYLVALLIHKWETPWARLFPIRLVLRLGAEYRYYPCPVVSIRHRQSLYTDIGHTIINILADFRQYSYTLPTVRGLVVHMEDRQTTILLPRNRYDQVIRALNNSNDSVLAFGANLSLAADSHLVCIQSSDDENTYHTQAINIHNKPRRVTGASFVVFNGALKPSCGLSGKSSIVEDGLMVQVPGDTMTALRTALRDMRDYSIRCGPHAEETVLLRWTVDDTNFNIGVKSCIDGRPLDGVPSMRVHNGTDYLGQYRIIRWTEVFILQCEEVEGSGDPLDISRLSESLARATCVALVPYLDLLATANLTTIGLRAAIHPDNVGYEAGSNCEKLPPLYMNSLDNELVAVVHQAAITCQDTPCTLELIFRVMES